jgi:hypothetical protein
MKNFIFLLIALFSLNTGCKHSTDPNPEDKSLRGWQIDSTNTGLAGVGVDKNLLPVYSGTNPIPAGSAISMKKIIDPDCSAGNITFDRCWIVETGYGGLGGSANGLITAQDCDIEATQYQANIVGNVDANQPITVLRCNLRGGGVGININGPGTIQQCYVHDLISYLDNHVDGCTRRYGIGQVNIIDNFINSYTNPDHTSATVFLQDNGFFDNILFRGNLFSNGINGGSVVLECKDGHGYGTHLIMDNNRFLPKSGDEAAVNPVHGYGYSLNYGNGGASPGWGQWTNNYINSPGKPDNKGAVMLEPSK